MPQTHTRAGRRPGKRAVRLLVPLAGALATACCVSACGGATAPTSSGTPASSVPPSGQGQGTAAAGRSTPGAALADWIRQVAAGNRSAACQDMREPGLSAGSSEAACMSAKGSTTFTALHGNFVTDGIRPSTPISVASARIKGTNATVSGGDIHLSGTTLDSLMAAHSTGVKPGQLTTAFDLSRIDGGWYVTGMNMDV